MLRVAGLSFQRRHAEKADCHPEHVGYCQGFEFQGPQEDKNQDRPSAMIMVTRMLRGSLTQADGEAALVDIHAFKRLLA